MDRVITHVTFYPLMDRIMIPIGAVVAATSFMDIMNGVVVVLTASLLVIRIIKALTENKNANE